MCLCEDRGGRRRRRRRRGRERARGWGAQAPPRPPTRAALPPRLHRPHRPRRGGDPLGARGRGSAWKERESKSKAGCALSFPNFAPCGGRRPAAPRVPTAPEGGSEAERKGRGGRGGRERGVRGEPRNIC